MPVSAAFRPSTRHGDLGSDFYDIVPAARFPQHVLRYRNQRWAARVGLDRLSDEEWIGHFGRFEPLPGSFRQPLALRYHGHQFRTYNPHLGDGRGFLFAQLHDLRDGRLLDLATKGSGRTPWSRSADGRLTLKGGLREVLATEMLEALGVETSKSFSLIETGEDLERGDEPSPTRSSVLVRLNHSHVRIGTFQRFLYLDEPGKLRKLLDHTIRAYMPDVWREDEARRAAAFLEEVCRRVARMGAQWMAAGFVHGVLNTDNINVTGESFDYGPWRFLPVLDAGLHGRLFRRNGPLRLRPSAGRAVVESLPARGMSAAAGDAGGPGECARRLRACASPRVRGGSAAPPWARSSGPEQDASSCMAILDVPRGRKAPYEQTLFDWHGGLARRARSTEPKRASLRGPAIRSPWAIRAQGSNPHPEARLDHPYFARRTPCTMLIDEVEAIWAPIAQADDWSAVATKLDDIGTMAEAYGTSTATP